MKGIRQIVKYESKESQRLDVFLVSKFPEHSRSYLQTLIKNGHVKIDDKLIQKTGFKLDKPLRIEVVFPPAEPSQLEPEAIPLDIIFEDSNLVAVNKPPDMVVHPSAGHSSGTLVHAILAHSPDIQGVGGVKRPGVVHRLDKDTSGIILLAKNDKTHRYLQSLFKNRKINKTYLALVDGAPPTNTGRIEAAIGRDSSNRQRMAIVQEKKGKLGISEYKVIEKFDKHTLLEVNILTGRTHQIRLHMAFLKCPVVGDRVYGYNTPSIPVQRQMLHAYKLEFVPPESTTNQIFIADIPKDFKDTLDYLKRGDTRENEH
jgi:23S rRNA pseudouridine1911/1915/1917 synthase